MLHLNPLLAEMFVSEIRECPFFSPSCSTIYQWYVQQSCSLLAQSDINWRLLAAVTLQDVPFMSNRNMYYDTLSRGKINDGT